MGLSEDDKDFIRSIIEPLKDELAGARATIDALVGKVKEVEAQVGDLQERQKETIQTQEALEAKVSQLDRDIQDLRRLRDHDANRAMRKNLIFYGIPRSKQDERWSDCEEAVERVIREVMGAHAPPELGLERVHRMTGHKANPTPIVALFSSWKTKEAILAKRRDFKDKGFDVTNQYTPAVRAALRHLIPIVEDARNKGKSARIAFDRAIINDAVFVFDQATGKVRMETEARPRREPAKDGGARKRYQSASPEGASGTPARKQCPPRGGVGGKGGQGRGGRGGAARNNRGHRNIGEYFSPARGPQYASQFGGDLEGFRGTSGSGSGYTQPLEVPQYDGEGHGRDGGGFRNGGYGYGARD